MARELRRPQDDRLWERWENALLRMTMFGARWFLRKNLQKTSHVPAVEQVAVHRCSQLDHFPRPRPPPLCRFVFLGLDVITQSYIRFRHDDVFLQEHWATCVRARGVPLVRPATQSAARGSASRIERTAVLWKLQDSPDRTPLAIRVSLQSGLVDRYKALSCRLIALSSSPLFHNYPCHTPANPAAHSSVRL